MPAKRSTPKQEQASRRPPPAPRLVTLKPAWADYEFGPYERFPEPRRAVLEGYLMQRYDPTIGAALTLIEQLIATRLGDYTHPEERLQQFVRDNLEHLRDGRRQTILRLLSCLWAGFAVAVKRWDTQVEGWVLTDLELLHPLTFFPRSGGDRPENQGVILDQGQVTGFRQFPETQGEEPEEFLRDQVVYWPFMRRLREEVYGRRLTDRARRSWFMRVKIEQYWSLYLQRNAMPVPVFRVPKGMQEGPAGNDITNSEFYAGFIANLAPGQGLAIEADPEDQFAFDLLESKGGGEQAYEGAVKYHNAELFKAMLTSPLMFEEASKGTRAQGTVALDITVMLIEAIREELGGVLVQDLARPLIEYNFGERDEWGEWQFEKLQDDDLEMLARAHEMIARAQVITPNDADERKARELFGPAGFATEDEITPEDLATAAAEEQRAAEAAAALQEARAQAAQANLQPGNQQQQPEGEKPPPAR